MKPVRWKTVNREKLIIPIHMAHPYKLLIIGPTPPPYHGVAVALGTLLQSRLRGLFEVYHLELADRRGIAHVNIPDFHDVILFVKQWLRLVSMLFHACPTLTYLVLSQTTMEFFRDNFLDSAGLLEGEPNCDSPSWRESS